MRALAGRLAAVGSLVLAHALAAHVSRGFDAGRERTAPAASVTYWGMCDASAAVALDDGVFVVSDDEQNVMRIYQVGQPDTPVQLLVWDTHLGFGLRRKDRHEADIEGAAARGNRVYWISSHGRNNEGKWRQDRHRFFAMDIDKFGDRYSARPVGMPYFRLAHDIIADERMTALGLEESVSPYEKVAKKLAPKRSGMNIEGLAAGPDGKSLLIAFRNPLPGEKALILPLLNPDAVLEDQAAPQFGDPTGLTLAREIDGRTVSLGIRSIDYAYRDKAYLIIAGSHDEKGLFGVYRWSGRPSDAALLLRDATDLIAKESSFSPEALILYPNHAGVQLLSDDGGRLVRVASAAECQRGAFRNGHCEAKWLLDDSRKSFRSLWIDME